MPKISKTRSLPQKHCALISFFQYFHEKLNVLMPLHCKNFKNTSTTSKTLCSQIIFSILSWKSPCCHAHICSKNVNSVKTILYYELKTSIGYSLFRFSRKNHCFYAHTKRPFSKKKTVPMLIFCQKKRSFSWRHYAPMFFFQISHEPQSCHIHIWIKKRQFWQNYSIWWTQKINRMPFFPIFHE